MSLHLVAAGLVLAAASVVPAARETPEAREQARLCEALTGEDAMAACRHALTLGLGQARLGSVRQMLARRLAAAERWPELVEHLREDVAAGPEDADVRLRLGSVLLFSLGRAEEAVAVLREAVRLDPSSAWAHALLALALSPQGQAEAAAEFEEALRIDDTVLANRPAALEAYEAVRKGTAWP
jgi:tetratricopeptide (TPR) repeat protein